MLRHDDIAEPWFSFLKELDQLATTTVRLDCIGGFVVTTLYGLSRPTGDVDVLEIAPRSMAAEFAKVAMQGGPLFKKYGIYLDQVSVAQPPYDYESRQCEMFPGAFRHLRLMALDPYDLALTKLERNIQRDRNDVLYLARTVPFDLSILQDRYRTEQRPYLGNPIREDSTLELWMDAITEDRSARDPQGPRA